MLTWQTQVFSCACARIRSLTFRNIVLYSARRNPVCCCRDMSPCTCRRNQLSGVIADALYMDTLFGFLVWNRHFSAHYFAAHFVDGHSVWNVVILRSSSRGRRASRRVRPPRPPRKLGIRFRKHRVGSALSVVYLFRPRSLAIALRCPWRACESSHAAYMPVG